MVIELRQNSLPCPAFILKAEVIDENNDDQNNQQAFIGMLQPKFTCPKDLTELPFSHQLHCLHNSPLYKTWKSSPHDIAQNCGWWFHYSIPQSKYMPLYYSIRVTLIAVFHTWFISASPQGNWLDAVRKDTRISPSQCG